MEVKRVGKRLWHTELSFAIFLCLMLCACKAEKEMEDVSGTDIKQERDAVLNLGDEEGNSEAEEDSDPEGNTGVENSSGLDESEDSKAGSGLKEDEGVKDVSGLDKEVDTNIISTLEQNDNPNQNLPDAPQKTPEEILAEQLIDETHDAFLVETGGKTGTVLVTAQRQLPYTFLEFSVWDLNHMEKPIQVFDSGGGFGEFGRDMVVDANFDGWADFGYLKSIHDGNEYWEFWYWNERESQFEERWLKFYFINPVFSADTKIVSCLNEESGFGNFYQWQNDSFYNVRSITTTYKEDEAYLSVTDYFGDIPIEIFGRSYEKGSGEWREQWELWCDLNYHGEPGSVGDLLQNGIPEGTISAFVIRAGSEAREIFVTAQPCGADDVMDTTGAQCWYDNGAIKFSVWNPNDMDKPIQTMCKYVEQYHYQGAFSGQYQMVDANFDGYMDFSWICHSGNQPIFYYLWLWDEEQGKFVEEPAYNEISSPVVDAKKKIISGWSRSSAATDGTTTFHKWIDGELLCVRYIFVWREIDAKNYIMTVEDRIGGEMVEVYREEFELDWDFIAEREKWLDLDYHGGK